MAPRIIGLSWGHSASPLVTAIKSEPKNTPLTPATSNSRWASGDRAASSRPRRSRVPDSSTTRPGRNFMVAGFGVASVWMNIGLSIGRQFQPGSVASLNSLYYMANLLGSSRRVPRAEASTPRRCCTRPVNDAEKAAQGSPSRESINFQIGEVAGDDGDRNGIIARGAADGGDQRAGAFGTGAGAEDEDENVLVLVDQLQNFFGFCALAQRLFGGDARDVFGPRRIFDELGARLLMGFRAHDIGDT